MAPYPNENIAAGSAVNKHIHMLADYDLNCPQGHVYTLKGELVLVRTA